MVVRNPTMNVARALQAAAHTADQEWDEVRSNMLVVQMAAEVAAELSYLSLSNRDAAFEHLRRADDLFAALEE